MKHVLSIFTGILCLVSCIALNAQHNGKKNFDAGWKFHLGDVKNAQDTSSPDKAWRSLNLPHDWSIEGAFRPDNPATNNGGSLPGGIGWYRKTFTLSPDTKNNNFFIEFDGVYMNSKVWINGHYLGNRPFGYASFMYELTPYLKKGKNVIAVRVDNSLQQNSRWYSGSGIYRHVWLTTTSPVHVDQWGTYVTTPIVNGKEAIVKAITKVVNAAADTTSTITLVSTIVDAGGKKIATQKHTQKIKPGSKSEFTQQLTVTAPHLWDVENPYLYKLLTELYTGATLRDTYTTPIGIRSIRFDADKGFFLNEKPLKILGVCEHHDLGALGAALNDRALERQLEILKGMGCNAIRTSHNPPAPELLDLCDRMGFLVMDEAFDCWYMEKVPYDFHLYFKEWHERELSDMVIRDRNHPSVILWSIGNEIEEQWDSTYTEAGVIAKQLVNIVKKHDTTRLVTSGFNAIGPCNANGYAAAVEVVGLNYFVKEYDKQKKLYPNRLYIASETTSSFNTRGVYHTPQDSMRRRSPDMLGSAYDNCWAPHGLSHENGWKVVKERDFISGLFIWTGFDYIGEPAPYNYPAVSSYFGVVDLCGFPKDVYYMYQSQWTKDTVLHLVPHWNWTEKDTVDVMAYTNCDEVKLYLNDKFIGSKNFSATDKLHLRWKVPFKPGTLKAEGFKNGKLVRTTKVKTAGDAVNMELIPDRKIIKADGVDISFVTIKVTDAEGVMVPTADPLIEFEIQGEGKIVAVDNGNPISLEPFIGKQRRAFNGMCMVVIQSAGKKGPIILKASSLDIPQKKIMLQSQ